MQKPASIRAALADLLPELHRDPDRFMVWLEKGAVRSTMIESRAFAWSYTLNIVITGLTAHPSLAMLAICDWLRTNQPDLLAPNAPGFRFEADIIDDKTVDLMIELDLDEPVVLQPRADGSGFDLEHLPPPVLFPDDLPLAVPPSLLRQIWWKGELLVPLPVAVP